MRGGYQGKMLDFSHCLSKRKATKKTDYSKVRIESFDQFLGENARSPVKKFISLRLYYEMTHCMTP